MKTQNDLIIPAQTLELCQLRPGGTFSLCAGKNTLVVIPERMTAIQAVNTLSVLTEFTADLIIAIKAACGACEEQMETGGCPYEDCDGPDKCPFRTVRGPGVTLTDEARKAMGIPLDAKLDLLPDEGEGLVCAADYEHDITDVPIDIRKMLTMAGVCLGRLDEVLMGEKEVWHG